MKAKQLFSNSTSRLLARPLLQTCVCVCVCVCVAFLAFGKDLKDVINFLSASVISRAQAQASVPSLERVSTFEQLTAGIVLEDNADSSQLPWNAKLISRNTLVTIKGYLPPTSDDLAGNQYSLTLALKGTTYTQTKRVTTSTSATTPFTFTFSSAVFNPSSSSYIFPGPHTITITQDTTGQQATVAYNLTYYFPLEYGRTQVNEPGQYIYTSDPRPNRMPEDDASTPTPSCAPGLTWSSTLHGCYLIHACSNPTAWMQDWTGCSKLTPWGIDDTTGDTVCLADKRDGKTYQARRLADGNCWMSNNLAYGASDKFGTDVCADRTYLTPAFGVDSVINTFGGQDNATTSYGLYGDCRGNSDIEEQYRDGYYYNWAAAMQQPDTYMNDDYTGANYTGPQEDVTGICPAGWTLPTGDYSGQFQALRDAADTDEQRRRYFTDPQYGWRGVLNGMTLADEFDALGVLATYWSSNQIQEEGYNGAGVFFLANYDDPTDPYYMVGVESAPQGYGFGIRCIKENSICPAGQEYDAATDQCVCVAGLTYDSTTGQCVCPVSGQTYSKTAGRCVCTSAAATMQEWNGCDGLSSRWTADTTQADDTNTVCLRDERNNKFYEVRKLADGKCWMADSLAYGFEDEAGYDVCSSAISNIGGAPDYDRYVSCWNNRGVSGSSRDGYYYNLYAATMSDDMDDLEEQVTGVCPGGWHLPSTGDGSELANLYNALDDDKRYRYFSNPQYGWHGLRSGYVKWDDDSYDNYYYSQGIVGAYWSATLSDDEDWDKDGLEDIGGYSMYSAAVERKGLAFAFNSTDVYPGVTSNAYNGLNVRCVKDDPPAPCTVTGQTYNAALKRCTCTSATVTMQNWDGCDRLTSRWEADTTQADDTNTICLRDDRDDKIYEVRKLADGKCWMANNLAYGANNVFGEDVCEHRTDMIPATSEETIDNTFGGQDNATTAYGLFGDCRGNSDVPVKYRDGYYYNWAAAMQQPNTYDGGNYAGVEEGIIGLCPAGWVLPAASDNCDDFQTLLDAVGSNNSSYFNRRRYGWNPRGSGEINPFYGEPYDLGKSATYWASSDYRTYYYDDYANSFHINSFNVYSDGYLKTAGISIRCVRDDTLKCPATGQVYDESTGECACPAGQVYDEKSLQCRCSLETGYVWNTSMAGCVRECESNLQLQVGESCDVPYSGDTESFVVANDGSYKLEVWGAQGGNYSSSSQGGKGGYSSGVVSLPSETNLYVRVGGQGTGPNTAGGYNGGGATNSYGGSGGGATDIRVGEDSLYSRVIAAGGGGGAGYSNTPGGYGGGNTGGQGANGSSVGGLGGSQVAAGSNNTAGAFGTAVANTSSGGGGGGGWYGGASGTSGSTESAGGGGSGWVYTPMAYNVWRDGKPSDAYRYQLTARYYLLQASTIGGDQTFADPDGNDETGHTGHGYARITRVEAATGTEPIACPSNMIYDSTLDQCVCPKGLIWNDVAGQCECPSGQILNETTGICQTSDTSYTNSACTDPIAYLQDWDDCDSLQAWSATDTSGETVCLADKRDGKTYMVRKLPDDRCWMVNNLAYGASDKFGIDVCLDRKTMTKADSEASIKDKFGGQSNSTTTYDLWGNCRGNKNVADSYRDGYYYNWAAAMQQTSTWYGSSTRPAYQTGVQGLCPAGWVLPTGGTGNSTDFQKLAAAVNGTYAAGYSDDKTKNFFTNPSYGWHGLYSGYANGTGGLHDQGSTAYYWSSTFYSASSAYFLYFFYSSYVYPENSNYKYYGHSIRCLKQ